MPVSRTTLEGSSKIRKLSLYNDYCQVVKFMPDVPQTFKMSDFTSKYLGAIVAATLSGALDNEDVCWIPGLIGGNPVEDHADLGDMNHQDMRQPFVANDEEDDDDDDDEYEDDNEDGDEEPRRDE